MSACDGPSGRCRVGAWTSSGSADQPQARPKGSRGVRSAPGWLRAGCSWYTCTAGEQSYIAGQWRDLRGMVARGAPLLYTVGAATITDRQAFANVWSRRVRSLTVSARQCQGRLRTQGACRCAAGAPAKRPRARRGTAHAGWQGMTTTAAGSTLPSSWRCTFTWKPVHMLYVLSTSPSPPSPPCTTPHYHKWLPRHVPTRGHRKSVNQWHPPGPLSPPSTPGTCPVHWARLTPCAALPCAAHLFPKERGHLPVPVPHGTAAAPAAESHAAPHEPPPATVRSLAPARAGHIQEARLCGAAQQRGPQRSRRVLVRSVEEEAHAGDDEGDGRAEVGVAALPQAVLVNPGHSTQRHSTDNCE